MRNERHVWIVTAVLSAVTGTRAAFVFLRYPGRDGAALAEWSLMALWLLVPLGAVWWQMRIVKDRDPEQAGRDAAVRIAIAAYVPLLFALGLVQRLL